MFGEVLVVVMAFTFDGADDPLQMLALIAIGSTARADLQGIIWAIFSEELDKEKNKHTHIFFFDSLIIALNNVQYIQKRL